MIISSGIACGVLLGVIEGVGVLMQRMMAETQRPVAPMVSPTARGDRSPALSQRAQADGTLCVTKLPPPEGAVQTQ
jgi:hypothetical protein